MQNKELKNTSLRECPFCGGEAYLANVMGRNGVCCKNIKCDVVLRGKLDATKEEVIEAWNTRKPMDRIVEQLEGLPNVNSDYWNMSDLIDREDVIEIVKGGAE